MDRFLIDREFVRAVLTRDDPWWPSLSCAARLSGDGSLRHFDCHPQ
jgi:hypothetical protein